MSSTWIDAIRAVAPSLAGAIGTVAGGPLIGAALSQLSTAILGRPDGTEGEIEEAVTTRGLQPEQIVALKKNEQDFTVEMARIQQGNREIEVREAQVYAMDTANAREVFGKDDRVFWLGISVLLSFFAMVMAVLIVLYQMVTGRVTADPGTIAVVAGLLGTIVGYFASNSQQVINYNFGSSKGSKDSGDAVRQALASTATALKDAQSKQN